MEHEVEHNEEEWEVQKRSDIIRVEAICKHGIGHHNGVHGCDGCCEHCPKHIWNKVTTDL